jgi:hypothetical protein
MQPVSSWQACFEETDSQLMDADIANLPRPAMRSVALLGCTIALSVAVGSYQATMFYLGYYTSTEFEKVWSYVFPLLLAFWVEEDSRGRSEVYRPTFDMGFFMCLAWIIYLPFYLLRTRGPRGWLWIAGLLSLAFLGTILQLGIYAAS